MAKGQSRIVAINGLDIGRGEAPSYRSSAVEFLSSSLAKSIILGHIKRGGGSTSVCGGDHALYDGPVRAVVEVTFFSSCVRGSNWNIERGISRPRARSNNSARQIEDNWKRGFTPANRGAPGIMKQLQRLLVMKLSTKDIRFHDHPLGGMSARYCTSTLMKLKNSHLLASVGKNRCLVTRILLAVSNLSMQ